jgi:hypothetical protein
VKSGVKIALGTIGVGVAVASAALSFGTLWMNIAVAAKGILDLAQSIKTLGEGMDTTYEKLLDDARNVQELYDQREKAKEKGEGQKASKTAEGAKELMNQLLPFTKALVSSSKTIGDRARQFLGQVSQLEGRADDLVGLLNKTVGSLSKLPEKDMTPKLRDLAADMDKSFQKAFTEINDLHRQAQNGAKFGERTLKAVERLQKEDRWLLDPTEFSGKYGVRALALYSAVNFIYECASAGKALIPL